MTHFHTQNFQVVCEKEYQRQSLAMEPAQLLGAVHGRSPLNPANKTEYLAPPFVIEWRKKNRCQRWKIVSRKNFPKTKSIMLRRLHENLGQNIWRRPPETFPHFHGTFAQLRCRDHIGIQIGRPLGTGKQYALLEFMRKLEVSDIFVGRYLPNGKHLAIFS